MDLVAAAGVDVAPWAEYDGRGGPAANPTYCYNWSFVEPGRVVVVNLWHANLREGDGAISTETNMRRRANDLRNKRDPQSASWRRRAEQWDSAVQAAMGGNLPIRAVIIDGKMRRAGDPAGSSRVTRRLLDPVPWGVERYNARTGACTLTRGAAHLTPVDQFVLEGESAIAERRPVTGEAYLRSAEVRMAALLRADGRCEWCGAIGFRTVDGRLFLETHHVIPLGEGGADEIRNVAALCPNHHREAHHGAARHQIRSALIRKIARRTR